MRTELADAIVSPDGRFELRVEAFWERASPDYTTRVLDRTDGTVIFSCDGAPKAEFRSHDTLLVHYFGYEPNGVTVDLVNRKFRTCESEPWAPLGVWPMVETAYRRGWAAAYQFRQEQAVDGGVWVETVLAVGSLTALVLLLRFDAHLSMEARIVFAILTGLAALFFGWLWLNALRYVYGRRDGDPKLKR
jgi:hypothetical protein